MAITINDSSIPPQPMAKQVTRQPLLTKNSVASTRVLLERWNLAADAAVELNVAPTSLAWFQLLEGSVTLTADSEKHALDNSHIVFLPPGFRGSLSASAGAAILHAEVPDAASHDPAFGSNPMPLQIIDWTREPVLDSEHDARKRIYIATPKLFGTTAIKGEMIIYPPGTQAANHHHEGAEHFMYVLKGSGTAYANESPIRVRKGDLIYYGDRERHYLRADDDGDMVFVEFFVPGKYKTVWAPGASICTWTPTGRSISGAEPVRSIARHSSAEAVRPDV